MSRLHEHQGKELLARGKITIPEGRVAFSAEEAAAIVAEIGVPAVVKAQVWTTGRAGFGGIRFVSSADEARQSARELLALRVRNFTVDRVLVEKKLDIAREFYAGLIIDDSAKQPLIIFSSVGGSGIEEIAAAHPNQVARFHIDVVEGLHDYEARDLVRRAGVSGKLQLQLADTLVKLWRLARSCDARAVEINPLVHTADGRVVAADCRITVDDYAVYRHPDLGIEIARELDRPPSDLDKIAYNVEKNDYRGTFYFIQLEQDFDEEGYIGFHGAGGGGSMMSMDAVLRRGFKIANFCDTSGNPPASKVYRAAKIILSQPKIDAYFGSGSGVASQEQFHSARGLVKAFREERLAIPAVIRLGGNGEDLAVKILETYTKDLPATVEGYKKDDSADHCAERLRALVDELKPAQKGPAKWERPPAARPYEFKTMTGTITYDHEACSGCETKICVEECVPEILKLEDGLPVLAIGEEEARRGGCIECLACEIECIFHGNKGAYIDLPIPGLEEYRAKRTEHGHTD